jgi:DNA repair exonuclease SbcCD ATPase subunit
VLPSSKSDSKHEARFVARIDVLGERVDTLAATVATTASAMARKDGEIASLHRELQLRDEQIQALAARPQAPAAGDPRELQQLREAVAALSSERSTQGGSKLIDELTAKVGLLGQRLETLSTTVSTTAAGLAGRDGELATIRKRLETHDGTPTADPGIKRQLDELASTATGTKLQLDGQAAELESLKSQLAERQGPPADELRAMLTMLRTRVESLDGLRAGVTQEALDDRLMDTDEALARLSQRVEELATGVESATASLSDKEHELAALNRHFMESSSRIETIVDDLREALGAFTDTDPDALAALTRRLDTTSAGTAALANRVDRLEATHVDDLLTGLAERMDMLDGRVEAVAIEIKRAKTLWPVALRSLEARLDDVAPPRPRDDETVSTPEPPAENEHEDDSDDLLAELRDSLQAMENVAAELERSQGVSTGDAIPDTEDTQQAMAGGARVVPLRPADP